MPYEDRGRTVNHKITCGDSFTRSDLSDMCMYVNCVLCVSICMWTVGLSVYFMCVCLYVNCVSFCIWSVCLFVSDMCVCMWSVPGLCVFILYVCLFVGGCFRRSRSVCTVWITWRTTWWWWTSSRVTTNAIGTPSIAPAGWWRARPTHTCPAEYTCIQTHPPKARSGWSKWCRLTNWNSQII